MGSNVASQKIALIRIFQMPESVDPALRARMVDGYDDCLSLTAALPAKILKRSSKANKLGRQLVFLKCAMVREHLINFPFFKHCNQFVPFVPVTNVCTYL